MAYVRPIIIVDYDPCWPAMFEKERARLQSSIGDWMNAIEHIGSTSVPGLAAKPVIDILVGVRALGDADTHCIAPIVNLGYEYVPEFENVMPYRRFFRRSATDGLRSHQIHLVEKDTDFWHRHLLFRDYLRTHPARAQEYAALKRHLAPQFTDVNDYADAKTDFIRATEGLAAKWRQEMA
jgi:GrpB-like predicted nucleotidyltransferase (UPF0157 family)